MHTFLISWSCVFLTIVLAGCVEVEPRSEDSPDGEVHQTSEASASEYVTHARVDEPNYRSASLSSSELRGARATLRAPGRAGDSDAANIGVARFTSFDSGVRVEVRARRLRDGLHAVHIHAAKDCADAAGSPHFAPEDAPHGDPESPRGNYHAGDLGNIRFDDGSGRLDRIYTALSLDGATSAVGQTLVIHTGQDDLNTQPDGGAGEVAACGLITAAP